MHSATYTTPLCLVRSHLVCRQPLCNYDGCVQSAAIRLVIDGKEACVCCDHAEDASKIAAHIRCPELTKLVTCALSSSFVENADRPSSLGIGRQGISETDVTDLTTWITNAGDWNLLENPDALYRMCLVYKATVQLMQRYANLCDFVSRKDQEGWAALVTCVTCMLCPRVDKPIPANQCQFEYVDIIENQLVQYVGVLAESCNVSVLFSANVVTAAQVELVGLARGLWACGHNRVHTWWTDVCPESILAKATSVCGHMPARKDPNIGDGASVQDSSCSVPFQPELCTWITLCYAEAVRITSLVMTVGKVEEKEIMLSKLRNSAKGIVDSFFRVKPRNDLQHGASPPACHATNNFTATLESAKKTHGQHQFSYITAPSLTGEEEAFDEETGFELANLCVVDLTKIVKTIEGLVCRRCLVFVTKCNRPDEFTNTKLFKKHVLCTKCAEDTNEVDTTLFDGLLGKMHMTWGLFVSALRRLTPPPAEKSKTRKRKVDVAGKHVIGKDKRGIWSSMGTLAYAMGVLPDGNPGLKHMPMGDMTTFEANCKSTHVMDVDVAVIEGAKANGCRLTGMLPSYNLHTLLQSMDQVVTDVVFSNKFEEAQPTILLINAIVRILMAENKLSPRKVTIDKQEEVFADGAYKRDNNRCYEDNITAENKSFNKRFSCKWVLRYATSLLYTALEAVSEWGKGKRKVAEILTIMAVNTQVPGKKNDKGKEIKIDWRCRQLGPHLTKALNAPFRGEVANIKYFDSVEKAFILDRNDRKPGECNESNKHAHLHDAEYVLPTLRLMLLRELIQLVSSSKITEETYHWLGFATNPNATPAMLYDEKGGPFKQIDNEFDRYPRTAAIVSSAMVPAASPIAASPIAPSAEEPRRCRIVKIQETIEGTGCPAKRHKIDTVEKGHVAVQKPFWHGDL